MMSRKILYFCVVAFYGKALIRFKKAQSVERKNFEKSLQYLQTKDIFRFASTLFSGT